MSLHFLTKENCPRDTRDYEQIREDHRVNLFTLRNAGILRITHEASFLNERPEVFNAMFGFSPLSEIILDDQIEQAKTEVQVGL
ncbi:MAG TPA: hypothetical protein VFN31_01900 [Candidatus Saccharimonadales bacterium]|nr:hypothetical protein [Candidatus Saccharimonadales bacterium]